MNVKSPTSWEFSYFVMIVIFCLPSLDTHRWCIIRGNLHLLFLHGLLVSDPKAFCTKLFGIAIMMQNCMWGVSAWNFGWDTRYPN